MAKTLSQKTLKKSWLNWITFGQQCYNYEIMQGLGFTTSMIPVIDELYPDDAEARKEALNRHLTYYNTENNWGAVIAGIVASMEEEKANGANITDGSINSIKAALSGPLAGIGDTVTQSLVKTCLLGICCDMALKGSVVGPILFFVAMSCYTLGLSRYVYYLGYNSGKSSVTKLLAGGKVAAVTEALGALGLMVVGSMIASNVNVTTPITLKLGQTAVGLQGLLNSICPKLLSIVTVFICYRLVNKGVKPIKIVGILFAVGLVAGFLGILA